MLSASPNQSDIAQYYDQHTRLALRDWVHGNQRITKALRRCRDWLPPEGSKVLDIGCGIGSSAHTLAETNPAVRVVGVDISPGRIAIAEKLFASDRVTFHVSAMTTPPPGGPFDLAVMIDVYEHVPVADRPTFHASLNQSLTPDGVVVMTVPSPLHQRYLAEHQPAGLQVVDETIGLTEITGLADDIGGTVLTYEFVPAWCTNQYIHVVIGRNPCYQPVKPAESKSGLLARVLPSLNALRARRESQRRKELVRLRLGQDV
jgi:SAM-dependent methyltransferase